MKKGKNSPEKLLEKLLELDTVEFLGACKILGVELVEDLEIGTVKNVEEVDEGGQAIGKVNVNVKPRDFSDIWCDLCDKLESMNRIQRRNLGQLIYAATKKEKEKK